MSNYRTGWPDKKGLYKCKVDGKERTLHHHHCKDNGRHWWTYTDGSDVIATEPVTYTMDEAITLKR